MAAGWPISFIVTTDFIINTDYEFICYQFSKKFLLPIKSEYSKDDIFKIPNLFYYRDIF
jgi:hypothetical protein